MANDNLTNPVVIQAQRIDASILPSVFSQPYLLYVIQQSTDVGNVANKANEAADGAYQAQEKNDEQDVTLAQHTVQLFDHEGRITELELDVGDLQARMTTAESDIDYLLDVAVDHEARISALEDYTYRQAAEVAYVGVSLNITTTEVNFLQLIGTLTPTSGTLSPFFDTTTGLMTALDKSKNLYFKLSIRGSYTNSSGARSMQFVFQSTLPNPPVIPDTIVYTRDESVTQDNVFINTFFSVAQGDDLTNPGIEIMIKANGSPFVATDIKLIATQ
ncbi:hypothetical protein K7V76_003141 [Vibrio fluvialis]|nr:hypothetical protein [Vibrio fluvialis]EKO3527560.1 hypothetical protein [Vibrio fluvialis]ELP3312365.1 hypothetical protein [Vibrio fluvialis]